MSRKKLPIGIDSFSEIREEKYYYVDKTAFIARMIDEAKHNFLSRPRRFGKSLLVDTLQNLFEGEKKLFKGLYIYDKWDWAVKYPVLKLDFGKGNFTERGQLHTAIMEQLTDLEDENGIKPKHKSASGRLSYLVKELAREKGQRVVILVDEYDKPILDALDTPGTEAVALANRNTLRGLYGTIKQCNKYIRFSFLTGVSKFSRAGIFSGINNLRDITLDPRYSSICGYTDSDIDTVFAPELQRRNRKKLDREKIKEWYDGYNWCGKEKVYNPFSILLLFDRREFESWWFPTGTPTFLINELKKRGGIDTLQLAGMSAGDELLSSFDIGDIETPALLFQTGYLTIIGEEKGEGETLYHMDFPNREVRQSLFRQLLRALAPSVRVKVSKQAKQFHDALVSGELGAVRDALHAFFADIPHQVYNPKGLAKYEGHYEVVAYAFAMGTGLDVRAEESTNHGRIDLTVDAGAHIYVFELKVLKSGVAPGAALQQIHDRGYADKFRGRGVPIHLVGVEFNPKKRNIENFDVETIPPKRVRPPRTRKKAARKKATRKKGARKKSTRKKRSPRR